MIFVADKENLKDIVSYEQKRIRKKTRKPEETTLDCKNLKYLALFLRRGNIDPYFSSKVHRKRLSSLNQRQQKQYIVSMKMKDDLVKSLGKNHKVDSTGHVKNKVLPISESTSSSSLSSKVGEQQCEPSDHDPKKDRSNKGETNKNKTLSRMKELLRWAANAKSEKRGKFGSKVRKLYFPNSFIKLAFG